MKTVHFALKICASFSLSSANFEKSMFLILSNDISREFSTNLSLHKAKLFTLNQYQLFVLKTRTINILPNEFYHRRVLVLKF